MTLCAVFLAAALTAHGTAIAVVWPYCLEGFSREQIVATIPPRKRNVVWLLGWGGIILLFLAAIAPRT